MNTLNAKESSNETRYPEKSPNENQPEATNSEINPPARLPDTFGRISLENAETSYVGSAHWIAILDGVCIFLSYIF